ncbi:MAG: helix-turn-helix transcriptional regulator [Helcococcus sp.]|nr:helix-turn-helix transcriptional regulator [Helcococcus sp.]
MLTKVGVFLRKLRLDKNEIMKDMAKNLGVSSSFLSAVENGKKRMPSNWFESISNIYDLNEDELDEFSNAIANTEEVVEINIKELSSTKREFAFSLARQLDSIDDNQILKFIENLKEREGN